MSQTTHTKIAFKPSFPADETKIIGQQYRLSAKIHCLSELMIDHLSNLEKAAVNLENLSWLAETIKDLQAEQDKCFYSLAKGVNSQSEVAE